MSFEDWTAKVVGELAALKPTGVSFEWAWKVALDRFPPVGYQRVHGNQVTSFRLYCCDAWNGRRPGTKAFSEDLVA